MIHFFFFSFKINNIIDRISYFFLASTVIKLPVNTNILEKCPEEKPKNAVTAKTVQTSLNQNLTKKYL